MKVFAQLSKIDEEKRLVYGIAAQEVADHSGEIMDYAKSKPNFESWSTQMVKDSNGNSLGNIRAMHGNVAAGKMTSMDFDDVEKSISICAKIVDDNEWQKVLEGVYTGFSMGGKYGKKWKDGDLQRYEAVPSEISLVDRPCIPTAKFFDIQKADGTIMQKAFQTKEEQDVSKKEQTPKDAQKDAQKEVVKKEEVKKVEGVDLEKVEPAKEEFTIEGEVQDIEDLGKMLTENKLTLGDAVKALGSSLSKKSIPSSDVSLYMALGKVGYDDGELSGFDSAALKSLHALELAKDLKVAELPIEKPEEIRAAWAFIGKEKNVEKIEATELKKIKDELAKAYKEKVDEKGPAKKKMAKGLYDASRLSDLLQTIYYLTCNAQTEAEWEGDNSEVPGKLQAVTQSIGAILVEMVTEETQELLSSFEPDVLVMEMGHRVSDLMKAGARHSVADKATLQAAHDALAKLGADCPPVAKAIAAEDLTKTELTKTEPAQTDMQKAIALAVEPMSKALDEAMAKIKKLEAQPMPAKGVLRVFSKGQDVVDAPVAKPVEVKKADGTVDEVASMIKGIYANGPTQILK